MENMNRAAAIFNIEKLNWLNGHYIRQMDLTDLTEKCLPYLLSANLIGKAGERDWKIAETNEPILFNQIKKIIALEQERLVKLGDLPELVSFFFKKELIYDKQLLIWKKMSADDVVKSLSAVEKMLGEVADKNFKKDILEEKIKKLIEENKLGTGETLWPLRVALTGKKASPPPFDVAEILGKEKILERIHEAKSSLK